MDNLTLCNKAFDLFLSSYQIGEKVKGLADTINSDYHDKELTLLALLNGSFIFSADLVRNLSVSCRLSFMKMASYEGTHSSGKVKTLIGVDDNIAGKDVLILEDIIDTGLTLETVIAQIQGMGAKSVRVATLLFKPEAYCGSHCIDYVGWEIENRFVVGYGMDYKGYGRNLKDIYKLKS